MDKYGISRWEYLELRAFCRQYDAKRAKAASLIGIHGRGMSGTPRSTDTVDPVSESAAKREKLMADIDDIHTAAAEADGGGWAYALIESCCRAVPYDAIDKAKLPTSNRNAFFKARREFFWRLKLRRDAR